VGETSVVQRGKFIYERLICHQLGPPPPGAQASNPMLAAGATARARVEARTGIAACGACHLDLDYAGLGMEDLDALGRLRTRYASGAPVDAGGVVRALPEGPGAFIGTAGLAQMLASEPAVATCLTRQWYRYATSHLDSEGDQCHLAAMDRRFAASNFDLRVLLLSVASTSAFVYRAGEP
jgi:hypothetical protein